MAAGALAVETDNSGAAVDQAAGTRNTSCFIGSSSWHSRIGRMQQFQPGVGAPRLQEHVDTTAAPLDMCIPFHASLFAATWSTAHHLCRCPLPCLPTPPPPRPPSFLPPHRSPRSCRPPGSTSPPPPPPWWPKPAPRRALRSCHQPVRTPRAPAGQRPSAPPACTTPGHLAV
jgi:hypothetical protein